MGDVIKYRFRCRRRTAAEWTSVNEILLAQEIGLEEDTGLGKIGDGSTAWNDLLYTIVGQVNLTDLTDGQALIWDNTAKTWKPGNVGGTPIVLGADTAVADSTGTLSYPAKATKWLKILIGTDYYLVPAFKWLGDDVLTDLVALIEGLSPVAYWQMNDATGSTTLVDSVSGEALTLSGSYTLQSASLVQGDTRKSVLFSGGMATGLAGSKWTLGAADCSGMIVARWSGTTLQTFFSIRDSGPTNILAMVNANRVVAGDVSSENWYWNTAKANSPGTGYNTFDIHALGFRYNATPRTLDLFIDGIKVKTVGIGGTRPTAATMLVHIASNFGSQNLSGNASDLCLFDYGITDQNFLDYANIVLNGHT